MNILDSLKSAWKNIEDIFTRFNEIQYESTYSVDTGKYVYEYWYGAVGVPVIETTKSAVNTIIKTADNVKDKLLSIPRALKYVLIGAGVLAIIYLIFQIRKK